ncbi:MAG TPA: tRNA (guanosine(37)-N1)-methyltransferase TrmD [Propionibacteriaceae bacterium]|nr:tRNA (guanosine(37)-N1)-methyltransferase TrmD [Propionibacteriaceae bacterium]
MRIDVVSIFPAYLDPLRLSLVGKAGDSGVMPIQVHDLRRWTHDRHRSVDDTPYGGGPGMVMRPEPWGEALDELATPRTRLVLLTPSGRTFTQALAQELAAEEHLIIACGRYEGIDARVALDAAGRMRVDEVSIGDYVLNGGEAAALVVVEAVARLLPGVIGNPESLQTESHAADHEGLLEGPVYTKPPHWRGLEVPEVLLGGHHAKIAEWRRQQALARTRLYRPDLLPPGLEGLVVTTAQPSDAGELLTVQRAAFLTEARLNGTLELPPLTETLAETTESIQHETVLVARLRGRLVAAVRGRAEPGHRWYVSRLIVAPDLSGRGIGSLMMDLIEDQAPPDTAAFVLITGAGSISNHSFYRRRGYVETERTLDPEGVPVVVMERPIRAGEATDRGAGSAAGQPM